MQEKQSSNIRTIGVFAPHFQGSFIGEIANQIRQYCVLRGYRYVGFNTGGFSTYNSTFNVSTLDAAIIIRNAISNDLAKELCERGIATCSIAYDYFPLDIPVISSDNEKGAEIALNYLLEKGHKTIAFIGDLRHYDLRKRYEKYCELLTENSLPIDEDLFYSVPNTDISGGLEAGQEFIDRGFNATAIFCAAGFTTIGLIRRLSDYDKNALDNIDIVSYDAMPINTILCPNVSAVDQNVHLIAYRAVSECIKMVDDESSERVIHVEPKLIRSEDVSSETNPYLATSVDLPEIHNPAYMSSIINNNYIWAEEIYNSKLNDLMTISPLFQSFMSVATFSRISAGKSGKEAAKIMKVFTISSITKVDNITADSICLAEDFPPKFLDKFDIQNKDHTTHFVIESNDKPWGVISIYGESNSSSSLGSYLYMCGQLTTVAKMMGLWVQGNRQEKSPNDNEKKKTVTTADSHIVTWKVEENSTHWSKEALQSLGFVSEMDINIYQNMEISDRVHPNNITPFREQLANTAINGGSFTIELEFKSKTNRYLPFEVYVKSSEEEKGEHIKIVSIYITPLDSVV